MAPGTSVLQKGFHGLPRKEEGHGRPAQSAEDAATRGTDAELEAAIDQAALVCAAHPDRAERRAAFDRLRELVAQCSPERVEQMEWERGLRR